MDMEGTPPRNRKTVGNGLESLGHYPQAIKSFLQAEVAQIVGAELVAEVAAGCQSAYRARRFFRDADCRMAVTAPDCSITVPLSDAWPAA